MPSVNAFDSTGPSGARGLAVEAGATVSRTRIERPTARPRMTGSKPPVPGCCARRSPPPRGEWADMRNRALHDALRDLALDAAALLSSELRAGHEIPFDVVEEPGRGPILYRYRPLTKQFLASRWDKLRALPTWGPAANALGAGASVYLRVCGLSEAADPEPALQAMLELLYEDSTSFDFPEERFERVYGSGERTLVED